MNRFTQYVVALLACGALFVLFARADEDLVTAVHGVITKTDAASKTVVVKTGEGTEHTIHFVDKTAVHGTEAGAMDTFHGLKEGSEVAVHYTVKGSEKTAVEVDKLGKDGIKSVDGTVTKVGEGGKTVTVKAADGTEHVFKVAGHDTVASAKDLGKGADKTGQVTVYYTEEAGKKVAHFFQKL
ncbi:MAG TPA: hypothetical protein VMR90_03805 [Candidatus Cybelea sp.]|nr:hypothetical protein [Candidatus Cybelea sp.]